MHFDKILSEYVNECGLFQFFVVFIVCLNGMFSSEFLTHNFIDGYQQHWCRIPELQDLPHEQQRYIAIPEDEDGEYLSCESFNISYSDYSLNDFYYWNRSQYISQSVIPCTDWVYDQGQYVTTITSEVC